MNLHRAWIKESVSIVQVTSICTALLEKLVNKTQYCLRLALLSLMMNDPTMNERSSFTSFFWQIWHFLVTKPSTHVTHLWMILLTTALTPSTQIPFFLMWFKVNPLPPWPIVLWLQITTASVMLLVFGRTTGCASLLVSSDLLGLPTTYNTLLLSRKESSLNKLLDRFTPLELCVP